MFKLVECYITASLLYLIVKLMHMVVASNVCMDYAEGKSY